MGKLNPKLSWAMQRELEVRRALEPTGRSTKWMKGYRGAKRAARLFAEREAAARRRATGWQDLPYPIQLGILSQLSLADIHNLRESGFGGRDYLWRDTLRKLFLERRHALNQVQDVFATVSRGRQPFMPSPARDRYNPVQFCLLDRVSVYVGYSRNESGSPVVPDGIGEMRNLKSLSVASGAVVRSLPLTLSSCTELRSLSISGHAFTELPSVILTLRKLRVLDISKCNLLKILPLDIGDLLKDLNKLDIRDCDELKILPSSLLRRMEKAACSSFHPLRLSLSCFPAGYVQTVICPDTYPLLHKTFFGS